MDLSPVAPRGNVSSDSRHWDAAEEVDGGPSREAHGASTQPSLEGRKKKGFFWGRRRGTQHKRAG
jgi:hypothetical protein